MSIIQTTYPSRYYAQYDSKASQPAPITGWWDMWGQGDIALLPSVDDLLPLTEEYWQEHISGPQIQLAVQEGKIIEFTPTISAPLKQQAQYALPPARSYIQNTYAILNEPTPDAWVSYLKALAAIAEGTDTTSKALPAVPAK